MNIKKLTSQLEQMKGKTFTYGNVVHYVLEYIIDDEKFTIKTNLSEFARKLEAADDFLKYWVSATTTSIAVMDDDRQLATMVEKEKGQADDLISILKDNIKKVQDNAGYIPQAQAVNDNVKSIIEVQKMKLDYLKQLRGK
jgi:hypothetical protein